MTAVKTLTEQNLQSVLSFDGKDDYISLPPSAFGGAITIEAWVYKVY
ncbi:MAG: hypothetical protein AB4062_01005 [Crocosphaera sp.]